MIVVHAAKGQQPSAGEHTDPSTERVTARYAHVPDAALSGAADRMSARIAAALAGQINAEIVAFPSVATAQPRTVHDCNVLSPSRRR
jgi:hypothetical protein